MRITDKINTASITKWFITYKWPEHQKRSFFDLNGTNQWFMDLYLKLRISTWMFCKKNPNFDNKYLLIPYIKHDDNIKYQFHFVP